MNAIAGATQGSAPQWQSTLPETRQLQRKARCCANGGEALSIFEMLSALAEGPGKAAPKTTRKNCLFLQVIIWQSSKIIYFCNPKRFRSGLKSDGHEVDPPDGENE